MHITTEQTNLRSIGTLTTWGGGATKPGGGGPTTSGGAISPAIKAFLSSTSVHITILTGHEYGRVFSHTCVDVLS